MLCMKNLNPLQIAKYTFWTSFIIGNLFLFGFLFGVAIKNNDIAGYSAVCGCYYLCIAATTNLAILLTFLIWGIIDVEKRKHCLKGICIIFINIPLAALYTFIGFLLIIYFDS